MSAGVLRSRTELRIGLIAIALAFAGALGLASQAGAATQIGAAAPGSLALPANTTAMQFGAEEPYFYGNTYGSSAIITSWSTYGSGGTYQLKLKVGSAVATDEGIVRYESSTETVSGPGLQTFPARIRIFGNEQIGAYSPTGAPGFLQAMPLPVGHIVILKAGDQLEPPGQAFGPWDGWTNPADIKKQPYRLSLAATIEPDADGDDFGDESQDKCPGVRGDFDGCALPPKSVGGKAKRGAKGYRKCLAQANKAFKRGVKSAKRKNGKARGKALKATRKKKQRLVGKCKRRFGKGKGKGSGKNKRKGKGKNKVRGKGKKAT